MEALNLDALFANLNINPWVLILVGGMIAFIGVFKILSKGISLMIWVLLVLVGASAFTYGLRQENVAVPELTDQMLSAIEPGKNISREALLSLCSKLDEGGTTRTSGGEGEVSLIDAAMRDPRFREMMEQAARERSGQ
ncbi:MAG: hypothetical protein HQL50_06205 [Magnetococcales bacterium]|nr:hypothetical protein [Magnetococcales bacterium]